MYNAQESPTVKGATANFFHINFPLKKPKILKFIESLSLLGTCNGYSHYMLTL